MLKVRLPFTSHAKLGRNFLVRRSNSSDPRQRCSSSGTNCCETELLSLNLPCRRLRQVRQKLDPAWALVYRQAIEHEALQLSYPLWALNACFARNHKCSGLRGSPASARKTTAASSTALCSDSTLSIPIGLTHTPLTFTMSSAEESVAVGEIDDWFE